jgi:cyclohexanecarboxylate-CoA ligase
VIDEANRAVSPAARRTERLAEREALREGWRAAGWYGGATIGEAIAAGAQERPDDRIVFEQTDGGAVDLTLPELVERADATARRLRALGVEPGQAVVVQSPADAAGVELLVALWLLGAIVVPLVATAGPDEIELAIAETGAGVMVVGGGRASVPDTGARPSRPSVDVMVSIGDGAASSGVLALGDVEPARDSLVKTRTRPSAVACVLYTSGSTGVPKGVQHSHETLLAGIAFAGADPDSRTLTSFPAGHVASVLGLLRPFTSGGLTVVLDRWSSRRAVEAIETYGITASAGTPFYLATLLDESERSGRDISSLSRFLVGAAAVPPALVARAEAAGIVTWRTYGSTEHPAISGGAPDHPAEKRRLTDGKLGPGNEVRLVDEFGADVAPGDEGEILVRGPRQFLGYRNEALDDDAFDGSWFRTGDQGRLDADGHLTITDRVKDIIIRGGENISAREVEDVLAEHPAVDEIAVCAAPDDTWGEVVCAVVRVRPGGSIGVEQLRTFAADSGLAEHKRPARLVVVDDFPRTAAAKIRKRDLRPLL